MVMRDSPTGKRYGRRDPQGRIVEAYGFDLSPLAYRADEFIRIAAEAKVERERMGQFKRRATCARRAIAQIGETLSRQGPLPPAWPQLAAETAELVAAIRYARTSDDLALIAQSLESRKRQAESMGKGGVSILWKLAPWGWQSRPHTISTNPSFYPSDTVIASEESSQGEIASEAPQPMRQGRDGTAEKGTLPGFEARRRFIPANYCNWPRVWPTMCRKSFPEWRTS